MIWKSLQTKAFKLTARQKAEIIPGFYADNLLHYENFGRQSNTYPSTLIIRVYPRSGIKISCKHVGLFDNGFTVSDYEITDTYKYTNQ